MCLGSLAFIGREVNPTQKLSCCCSWKWPCRILHLQVSLQESWWWCYENWYVRTFANAVWTCALWRGARSSWSEECHQWFWCRCRNAKLSVFWKCGSGYTAIAWSFEEDVWCCGIMYWCQWRKTSRNSRGRVFGSSWSPCFCEVVQRASRLQSLETPTFCRWICSCAGSRKRCSGRGSFTCSFTKRAGHNWHGTWCSESSCCMAAKRSSNCSHRWSPWFCTSSFYQCWTPWVTYMLRRSFASCGSRWTGIMPKSGFRRRTLQE